MLTWSKDRRVREEAFKLLFGTYKKFENTIATSLTSSLKTFIFYAKTRKYASSLEASLKPNDIPVEVYKNAIQTINNLKASSLTCRSLLLIKEL